jgi:hypothetical protein
LKWETGLEGEDTVANAIGAEDGGTVIFYSAGFHEEREQGSPLPWVQLGLRQMFQGAPRQTGDYYHTADVPGGGRAQLDGDPL